MEDRETALGATAFGATALGATALGATAPDLRAARRRQVLKRAQIVFGLAGSTLDCLVIDETAFGVQVEIAVMTQIPEQFRFRFADGTLYNAELRWSRGDKLGLKFIGPALHDDAIERHRRAARAALKTEGVGQAVQMLRNQGFLRNEELRLAAEAAELAFLRLCALLE